MNLGGIAAIVKPKKGATSAISNIKSCIITAEDAKDAKKFL